MNADSSKQYYDYDFIPRNNWRLDSVHETFAKLFICDILRLTDYPTGAGAFAYKNHPISKVDVVGWLVKVHERPMLFQYGVDDSTGVISCSCWKNNTEHGGSGTGNPHGALSNEAVGDEEEDHPVQPLTHLELGDIVHIRGRLKRFRNRMEISAAYYCKVDDPICALQIHRMQELPRLYETVYDKPFVLPSHIARSLRIEEEAMRMGLQRESQLVARLYNHLQVYLANDTQRTDSFHLLELETVDSVMTIACTPCYEYRLEGGTDGTAPVQQIRGIILKAVEWLEREGYIFRSGMHKDMYEVIRGGLTSRLNRAIFEILCEDSRIPKYEDGCHYLHIKDRLCNTDGAFQNISADTVRHALYQLEESSEVISTTTKHFLPVR